MGPEWGRSGAREKMRAEQLAPWQVHAGASADLRDPCCGRGRHNYLHVGDHEHHGLEDCVASRRERDEIQLLLIVPGPDRRRR